MNSLFKPYLPVDEEGFVTVANSNDILNKEYALAPLIRCIKKAELRSEVRQNEEIIILTDDEEEDDSFSNHGASSATCSHHDEMSNDFDWYSASSQTGNQSSHSQNIVETVSIDSPPPQQPYNKNTPSFSSLDSCDLNMDTTNSLVTDRNGESAQHSDIVIEQQPSELPSTSEANVQDVNRENNRNLSTLDESMFNRLVNDINSTQVSLPSNGSASSDIKIAENGESSQTDAGNSMEVCQTDDVQSEKFDKENEQFNGILTHEPVPCTSNGDSSLTTLSSVDHNPEVTDETPSTVQHNHIDINSPAEVEPVKNCDNIISSDSPLKNHGEKQKTINEVVNNDLKNHVQSPNECSTSNDVQVQVAETPSKVNTASSPIPESNDVEIESNRENENIETVQANLSIEFLPAAESTASVINETSLLSKSEQDVLFKDREAALIFNDLWSNGPTTAESPKPNENKSPRLSNDSPITFLANGIDPNIRLKTYTRRPRRLVETKTISTQTSRYSLSGCPSPVTTIDDNNSSKKNKYLLTEKDDDELFLRDIFNSTELPARSGSSPRIRSPMYLSSTPATSTPIASTSIDTTNVTENTQSLASVNASEIGSAGVVVKRKRGRPRKHPLPEPRTTPIVPKPPKAPRQPRKPRQTKPPKEPGEEIVFEKRVLRARKPKQQPAPEPVEISQEEIPVPVKPKRSRRRNTIKMTIDAIFNTQSTKLRAVQARRISQILGIPFDSQKIATILKRRNYNKSINVNRSNNSDSNLNESSMLQTFINRSNGQMANSTAITNETSSQQQSTPSTILARKTYIKPNITLSSFSSLSSALRRISFSARRMSFHTRRISFSATKRPKRTTSPRKSHTVQRYSAIDIFDTSKKRGRKKGTKDSAPRKKSDRKSKIDQNKTVESTVNQIIEIGDKVNNETIELVDLTNDVSPMEFDTTNEMKNQFANIHTALSSTQHTHNVSESMLPIIKRRSFLSEDTETDITNEFTTDPESTVEDTDDSHTRKSKRCRKRPKILDL